MNAPAFILALSEPDENGKAILGLAIVCAWSRWSCRRSATFVLWLRAAATDVPVRLRQIIALRLRGVPPGLMVDLLFNGVRSGLKFTLEDLAVHYLAGGNVKMVVSALIAARNAGLHLDFDRAVPSISPPSLRESPCSRCSKAPSIRKSFNAHLLASGQPAIDAVAGDGVHIKARVTLVVRTNLERCIGGPRRRSCFPG